MRFRIELASGFGGTLTLRPLRPELPALNGTTCSEPKFVADLFRQLLGPRIRQREVVAVATLNARHRLICLREVTVGSLMSAIVSPRDVLRAAFLDDAASAILLHNHPSGDPTPSVEDVQVTRRTHEACQIAGLRLLDHVIVADSTHYSFDASGLMERQ